MRQSGKESVNAKLNQTENTLSRIHTHVVDSKHANGNVTIAVNDKGEGNSKIEYTYIFIHYKSFIHSRSEGEREQKKDTLKSLFSRWRVQMVVLSVLAHILARSLTHAHVHAPSASLLVFYRIRACDCASKRYHTLYTPRVRCCCCCCLCCGVFSFQAVHSKH